MTTSRISLIAARHELTIAPRVTGPRAHYMYEEHGSYKHWHWVPGHPARAPSHAYPTSARHPDTLSLATRNSRPLVAANLLLCRGAEWHCSHSAHCVRPARRPGWPTACVEPSWLASSAATVVAPVRGPIPSSWSCERFSAPTSVRQPRPCAGISPAAAFFWVSVWPLPSFFRVRGVNRSPENGVTRGSAVAKKT